MKIKHFSTLSKILLLTGALSFSSCSLISGILNPSQNPQTGNESEKENQNDDENKNDENQNDENKNDENKNPSTENNLADWESGDFLSGVDVSMLYDIEASGGKYYDTDGTETELLQLLVNHGVNWIRLRVWNNPTETNGIYFYNYGLCTTEKACVIGKRAKDLGLKILLDLHYSDTWTDPGSQLKPASWDSITTIDGLSKAVSDFTSETMEALINAGAAPDMVQIGNEINCGLLLNSSSGEETTLSCAIGTENYTKVLNAASSAVKNSSEKEIPVMLHFAMGGDLTTIKYCAQSSASVDYDVLGLSYYPFFSGHKTASDLGDVISYVTGTLGKPCVVAETSIAWTCTWSGDSLSNQLWYVNEEGDADLATAYTNLSSIADAYGIATSTYTYSGTSYNIFSPTPANQKAYLDALIDIIYKNGGSGLFYWGGEWIVTDSSDAKKSSSMENQALFDYSHKVLSAVDAFDVDLEVPAIIKSSPSEITSVSSEDSFTCGTSADGTNYELTKLTVTQDESNLLVTVDFSGSPAMWQNNGIFIFVHNASNPQSSASVVLTSNQFSNPASFTSLSASADFAGYDLCNSSESWGSNLSKNFSWSQNSSNYLYSTSSSSLTYTIPFSSIANFSGTGVSSGDQLQIVCLVNSAWWDSENSNYAGCVKDVIPSSAVTVSTTTNAGDTVYINFTDSLKYSVK